MARAAGLYRAAMCRSSYHSIDRIMIISKLGQIEPVYLDATRFSQKRCASVTVTTISQSDFST